MSGKFPEHIILRNYTVITYLYIYNKKYNKKVYTAESKVLNSEEEH